MVPAAPEGRDSKEAVQGYLDHMQRDESNQWGSAGGSLSRSKRHGHVSVVQAKGKHGQLSVVRAKGKHGKVSVVRAKGKNGKFSVVRAKGKQGKVSVVRAKGK